MQHDFSSRKTKAAWKELSDLEIARVRYCYEIGATFVSVSLLEDTVINAMTICDRIQVSEILQKDASRWDGLVKKRDHLHSSTLGSLVSILVKHNVLRPDIEYLKWLKNKRDFFVHRYFRIGVWPGEMHEHQIKDLYRTLTALQIIFQRGTERIFPILGRAGLMHLTKISDGEYLADNLEWPIN